MSLSKRVAEDLRTLMPKIAIQVEQRTCNTPSIDMGTAENWLIREEVIQFSVEAIRDHIKPEVHHSD